MAHLLKRQSGSFRAGAVGCLPGCLLDGKVSIRDQGATAVPRVEQGACADPGAGLAVEVPGPLGLDMDGTITADPAFFARLARTVRARGQAVHVVTSRSPLGEDETREELAGLRIAFNRLYLLPDFGQPIPRCPHRTLSWYGQYLWQKVEYCQAHGILSFYDDDPKVLALFARLAPQIRLNPGWPRQDAA